MGGREGSHLQGQTTKKLFTFPSVEPPIPFPHLLEQPLSQLPHSKTFATCDAIKQNNKSISRCDHLTTIHQYSDNKTTQNQKNDVTKKRYKVSSEKVKLTRHKLKEWMTRWVVVLILAMSATSHASLPPSYKHLRIKNNEGFDDNNNFNTNNNASPHEGLRNIFDNKKKHRDFFENKNGNKGNDNNRINNEEKNNNANNKNNENNLSVDTVNSGRCMVRCLSSLQVCLIFQWFLWK